MLMMWVKPWRRCKIHFSIFVTLSSNDKKFITENSLVQTFHRSLCTL